MRRSHSRPRLFAILSMLLLCGCETTGSGSSYRVQMPLLSLPPIHHSCWVTDRATGRKEAAQCVTLLERDYLDLVIELKAACLALSGTPDQCQTIAPPGTPL